MSVKLFAATIGQGVWRSSDGGGKWRPAFSEPGLPAESRAWSLSSHPGRPGELLAGTDSGVYRWNDADKRWTQVPSELDKTCVWALAHAPETSDRVLAGTHPAGVYASDDGGDTWDRLPAVFVESCPFVGRPRVTRIRFDPLARDTLWVSVEIDGVHRSTDGGRSWKRLREGFQLEDIHDVCALEDAGGRLLLAATAFGLYRSRDDGESWEWQELDSPWQYTRALEPRADGSGTLFLTNGDGPPGATGRLLRSRDLGATWEDAGLPGRLNSTPWTLATHPADPGLIFAGTILGQLFRSEDGGETWTRLPHEFGELRALHCVEG